jgi:hypothetical protein
MFCGRDAIHRVSILKMYEYYFVGDPRRDKLQLAVSDWLNIILFIIRDEINRVSTIKWLCFYLGKEIFEHHYRD